MKPIALCVLVVNRYDLLADCIRSAAEGDVVPDALYVIHNGQDGDALTKALASWTGNLVVLSPDIKMGVAEGWNWFAHNVPEERIITNDDVTFAPHSIGAMRDMPGLFVSSLRHTHAFSCFLLRDACIEQVGYFDETISPGYVYFEDCDYVMRMRAAGVDITEVDCGVEHVNSATLKARPPAEVEEHHRKFLIAQSNYLAKWGALPAHVGK